MELREGFFFVLIFFEVFFEVLIFFSFLILLASLMAKYTIGGRNPSLYSLFETKENIQLFGAQTKLSKQRYLTAWDFSAQLCAIEHPGSPPCLFPSDFSLSPGRRLPESIIKLTDRCPSFIFHEQYHKKMGLNYDLAPVNVSDHLRERVRPFKSIPQKLYPGVKSSGPQSQLKVEAKVGSRANPPPSRLETVVSKSGDKCVSWQSLDVSPLKPPNKLHIHGISWTGLKSKIADRGVTEDDGEKCAESDGSEDNIAEVLCQGHKGNFFKNFDWLRRSILRKCLRRLEEIIINESKWPGAGDTFIKRLTGEFYELEKLILDFLEVL